MKSSLRMIVCLFVVIHAMHTPAKAVNMFFFPGDSFFHSRLTPSSIGAAKQTPGSFKRGYIRPVDQKFTFCGYAGFPILIIEKTPDRLSVMLKRVQAGINKGYPVKVSSTKNEDGTAESNAPHLFVYNRDFEPGFGNIGLRFNENWNNPPQLEPEEQVGGWMEGLRAIKYEPFLKSSEAIIADWRGSVANAPLDVAIPDGIKWWKVDDRINEPLTIDYEKIQLVIVPPGILEKCFDRADQAEFIVISGKEIVLYQWDAKKGDAVQRPIKWN